MSRIASMLRPESTHTAFDGGFSGSLPCGSPASEAAVDADVVWAKLAAMAEGARVASKQFWR